MGDRLAEDREERRGARGDGEEDEKAARETEVHRDGRHELEYDRVRRDEADDPDVSHERGRALSERVGVESERRAD